MRVREAKKENIKHVKHLCDRLMDCHLKFDEYYRLGSSSDDKYIEYFTELVTSDDSLILVAEDNGVVIGYLAGKIEDRPPVFEIDTRGWIDSAYVLEEHRGQGVGKEMTEKMLGWFKEKGIRYVELSVDSRNILAPSIWKSLGFETWQLTMKRKVY